VRFLLEADPSPGLLSRVLQPFARRDLVPDQIHARHAAGLMRVELMMDAMPAGMVALVEGNLRQIIGVRRVTRFQSARRPLA
jgi:acetolactate synthase regulatory subunit